MACKLPADLFHALLHFSCSDRHMYVYGLTERVCVCRTKGISLNLMGMATPEEVKTDVQIVLEALGVVPSETAALEAEVLPEVQAILKPVMNTTWKTGLQDNRK